MRWLDPPAVGALVADAIKRGELFIITHPESLPRFDQHHTAIARAFGSD